MATPKAPRVKWERNVDRGAAILEAATEVFDRDGFEAARIDEIARRAGVAKGSVYNHYADKEELFYSVVAREVDDLNRLVAALAAESGNLVFPDFVRRLVEGHFRHMLRRRGAATVVLNDSWGRLRDDLRRRIIVRLRAHLDYLTDLVALRAGLGGAALPDPERAATAMLGLCFIFVQRIMVFREADDDREACAARDVEFISRMIIAAVSGDGPSVETRDSWRVHGDRRARKTVRAPRPTAAGVRDRTPLPRGAVVRRLRLAHPRQPLHRPPRRDSGRPVRPAAGTVLRMTSDGPPGMAGENRRSAP